MNNPTKIGYIDYCSIDDEKEEKMELNYSTTTQDSDENNATLNYAVEKSDYALLHNNDSISETNEEQKDNKLETNEDQFDWIKEFYFSQTESPLNYYENISSIGKLK